MPGPGCRRPGSSPSHVLAVSQATIRPLWAPASCFLEFAGICRLLLSGICRRGSHLPHPDPLPQPPHCPPFPLCPLLVPPTIEQWAEGSGTLVSRPGELVTMACPVRGSAPIRMSWLKDGLPLPLSQRTRLHSSGRTLR